MNLRQRFSSRVFLFLVACIALFSFLAVRLIDLEALHGQAYLNRAEANRFFTQRLPARRGVILDRYHDPLVWNIQKYFQVNDPSVIYTNRHPVSREEAMQVLASTASATIVSSTERLYRYPQSLAHVVGYVGEATAEDLQRDETLSVGQSVGKAGLEYQYEDQLRGSDGQQVFEVDATGQKLRQVSKQDAQSGEDVSTSLDPYVTEVAQQALGTQRGAVIITDAATGKILTMTSKPGFDPNVLSQSDVDPVQEAARKAQVQSFFNDPLNLFFNRAVSGVYPPGSIFKLAVSFAGLESGAINETTQVVDTGKIEAGGQTFGNWYYRQYGKVEGPIAIVRAITRSNDIFFYKVAEWTGPDNVAAMARTFGLGDKTGIDLPAEARGLVPDPAWKEKYKNEKWFLGDTYHTGIGQGDLLTSPIQIAQMTQAIANTGLLCKVSLQGDSTPECRQVNLKPADVKLVMQGMIGVCSTGGTAFPLFPYNIQKKIDDPDPQHEIDAGMIGCKTGTAEFGAANDKGFRKTHGWFTSIVGLPDFQKNDLVNAPAATVSASAVASPSANLSFSHDQWLQKVAATGFPRRITITVLVESDDANPYKEGSIDAAPVAKQILEWMLGESGSTTNKNGKK